MIATRGRLMITAAFGLVAGFATLSAQPPPVQGDTPTTKGVVKKDEPAVTPESGEKKVSWRAPA